MEGMKMIKQTTNSISSLDGEGASSSSASGGLVCIVVPVVTVVVIIVVCVAFWSFNHGDPRRRVQLVHAEGRRQENAALAAWDKETHAKVINKA